MTVIVPVATLHVGSLTVVVGTDGGAGAALSVAVAAADSQPPTMLFTTMSYVAAINALDVALVWNVVPLSKLYVTPLDGLVTVIVPVATAHVGCTVVVMGTEGVVGWALTIVATAEDGQFDTSSLTITWYVEAFNALEISDVWNVAPLSKLYVTPLVGLVTVMTPVGTVHVGCATETVGTEGVTG